MGSRLHMIRQRSCWREGDRDWIFGTVEIQTVRNGRKTGGQFEGERSRDGEFFDCRGRGTEGGVVVLRSAAK